MPPIFEYEFNTPVYKGKSVMSAGLYIDGKFVDAHGGDHIEYVLIKISFSISNGPFSVINPATGKIITKVAAGNKEDVDIAVKAAQRAFETTWGLNAPGTLRARLLNKLGDLMEKHYDELAALEALDNGKTFGWAKKADVNAALTTIRYYAGWADKIQGSTIETTQEKLVYTRHEPIGVVGQILPWNFPSTSCLMCLPVYNFV